MITRDNYEEFFLLYTDNELSEAERQEVEQFIAGNPDLREEWEALIQCKLSPDARLSFPGRESLLKPEMEGSAHTGALLSYIDGELTLEERARIEAVILAEPRMAIELAVLRQTISQPDPAIVFGDKDRLYRPEKNRRVIPLPWLRVGIAAAVAGAIALILVLRPGEQPRTPAGGDVAHLDSPDIQHKPLVQHGPVIQHKLVPAVTPAPVASLNSIEGHPKSKKDRSAKQIIQRQEPQQQQQDVAVNDYGESTRTVLSRPVDPVATIKAIEPVTPANVQFAVQTGIPKEQSSFATQALQEEANDQRNNSIVTDEPAASGKTALRGIFRKLKRTLGKTADRDDDGNRQVLVGAFQVSLN